jgi:endo-alpha-1,4-polygalactosaminidase (GH114 family)
MDKMLNVTNFQLQYSNVDYSAVALAAPQLFITEAAPQGGTPALTDAQVASLIASGTKIVGYVESSVTDAGRSYWNTAWTSDGTDTGTVLATAPAWLKSGVTNEFGIVADIRETAWRQIVIAQAVDLATRGYSGVFLDDVAQYFALGKGVVADIQAFVTSMLTLVSEVKAAITAINPDAVVLVNSTPYIVSDAVGGVNSQASQNFLADTDAILLESFFGINRTAEEAGIVQAASALLPSMTVLTLEFSGTAYQNFLYGSQSQALGFVPGYSTSPAYNTLNAPRSDATTGDDNLLGTGRADIIRANSGNDLISAGDGADRIYSGTGNDTAYGGKGNDVFYGDAGNDQFFGEAGNDIFYGGTGADRMDGGAGVDRVYFSTSLSVVVDLTNTATSNGQAQGDVFINIEEVSGSTQGDVIIGNALTNRLFGQGGADRIDGGVGADTLVGGLGSDSFVFKLSESGTLAATLDKIFDYTKGAVGIGDEIDANVNLAIGGTSVAATTTQASINANTGVATFLAGSGTTLADALLDIATSMTTGTNTAGEFAFFELNKTGDNYMFISDGVAGIGANDVLVRMTAVTVINTISIDAGDVTILT